MNCQADIYTFLYVFNMTSTSSSNFKLFKVSNGTTYRYIHVKPHNSKKPYVLFLHGFPSSSYDWRHQIQYFVDQGYGAVAPDLLGYGGTDKPEDVKAYRAKKMAEEIIEVLEYERIQTVLGVGHDWSVAFNFVSA